MKRGTYGIVSIVLCLFLVSLLGAQERSHAKAPRVEKAQWHAMGSSPCAWWDLVNHPHGNTDIDGIVHGLRSAGFQCGVFVIEGSAPENGYASFQKLLEATKDTDIKLWVVIIPPSEGAKSLPYRSDYVAWSRSLAKLSLQYKNFRGFNIDDLDQAASKKLFTRNYVCQVYAAKRQVNPRFLFVPTIYALDRPVADRLAGCVDGVWLWWTKLEKSAGLQAFLENGRSAVNGRFPVYGGVYAHSTSWHKQDPEPAVFEQSLEDSCKYSDGAIIWQLSLIPDSPLLAVAKKFLPGGSSPYVGKCGMGGGMERAAK